mmetsp:Transcript_19599/g.28633  ORF Transcript_19599/g.28633 Transcript_19599/m.28633 type:complete len:177 (+) Transcript_19599:152-682(+)|eukprot:CAMPEP_0197239482 /NCGR_PEP_ID=MMETSP1429-20130617/5939_1 /TAXON_ID=49237 /ORGANISM="Chaetoceros  sp., Strain UNC1202" /LENGTH=176 /DNA_ID=CAMNT_0042698905 /DNA_START=76 /DNA_END=606 /DNA_ORIENTATION=+
MKLSLFSITLATTFASLVSGNSILPEKSCADTRFGCTAPAAAAAAAADTSATSQSSTSTMSTTLSIRGGEVRQVPTLGEVEDIIMKASAEGKLVVIDFTASWCGPCKMIAPLYDQLSEEYSNAVFLKVDVDENQDTAMKYGVSAMPTFLFIERGEIVKKLMGANPAALKETLDAYA